MNYPLGFPAKEIAVTVIGGVLIALLLWLPTSFAEEAIVRHDKDDTAHASQFSEIKSNQATFKSEIANIKTNQDRILKGQEEQTKLLQELLRNQK